MQQRSAIIVEDHPFVAKGIADYLQSACGFARAHVAASTQVFWHLLGAHGDVDVVVIDFWLPDGASLPLLAQLKATHPKVRILVMSADDNPTIQHKAKHAGAHGFVHKQESPDDFAKAITALLRNKTWFSQATLSDNLPKELPVSAQELGLTMRQGEVLTLVLQGLSNKRIAQKLSLAEPTVKEHISGILERLGAANRIELITRLGANTLLNSSTND